jgi:cardiolipin synthase
VRNLLKKKGARFVLILASTVGLLSGCALLPSTGEKQQIQRVPAPVTDHGLTLDWGHDVKTEALTMIQHSHKYCYLDMYELSDPDILHALIEAHQRGTDVRVVVDATEQHSQQQAVPTLSHAGVPVESQKIHKGISHIKMLITDGPSGGVLIGGMNFGDRSWDNNDASVHIPSPNPSFLAIFHWDWQRAQGIPSAQPSVQPPLLNERSTEQHVVQAIHSAKSTVYLEAFNLSDWGVLNALEAASRRGVTVEVLLDPHQSQNVSAANRLRDAGATVRFYKPYENEWMHAKILDVDHGETFIIGSANFSHQAYTYNHEGDVELHGYPTFDQSLKRDLTLQIERGTDYPAHQKKHTTNSASSEGD